MSKRVNVRVSNRHLTYGEENDYETVLYKLDDIERIKQTKAHYSQYESYTVYKILVDGRWLYIPNEDYKMLLGVMKDE